MKKSVSLLPILSLLLTLSACSFSSLNPFSSDEKVRSKYPENTVEYRCDGNKVIAVQPFNQGKNVWLIYPDHQVNLSLQTTEGATEKSSNAQANTAAAKKVYEAGVITLTLEANQLTLVNGGEEHFTGCQVPVVKEAQ